MYNNLIFDYDSSHAVGDYIAVEVSEYDSHRAINIGDMAYMVTIKMGLKEEKDVCAMSAVITDIVNKLYPDRKRFSNVPVITVSEWDTAEEAFAEYKIMKQADILLVAARYKESVPDYIYDRFLKVEVECISEYILINRDIIWKNNCF